MTGRLSRRELLRTAGTIGSGGAVAALLAACTPGVDRADGPSTTPTSSGALAVSPSPSGSTSARRVLIAYYSRPGENYYDGERRNLPTGNTEVLAGLLADRIDADVLRIEAQDPYPDGYDATVARNVREQDADARPGIDGRLPSLADYDVVLLGSPIWNVRPPMIMSTFAEALDWTGKRLHPFVTYAVSRLGRTEDVYREVADGARIGEGLAVLGETVADAGDEAAAWLQRVGLR